MRILERRQYLDASIEEVWRFIQNPANLDTITPADLCFRIIDQIPETMYNGLIIEYQLRVPLFGRQQWVTEIKHIAEGRSFVDEQRIGPYKFWYHRHELTERKPGTFMTDRIWYQLPYGPFGTLLNLLFVDKTLARIFDYRFEKLSELFNTKQHPKSLE